MLGYLCVVVQHGIPESRGSNIVFYRFVSLVVHYILDVAVDHPTLTSWIPRAD